MSLAINPELVIAVVLVSGQRYEVKSKSFNIDSYEFVEDSGVQGKDGYLIHGGGDAGVCCSGFDFIDNDRGCRVSGPLTAIAAVDSILVKR